MIDTSIETLILVRTLEDFGLIVSGAIAVYGFKRAIRGILTRGATLILEVIAHAKD